MIIIISLVCLLLGIFLGMGLDASNYIESNTLAKNIKSRDDDIQYLSKKLEKYKEENKKLTNYKTLRERFDSLDFKVFSDGENVVDVDGEAVLYREPVLIGLGYCVRLNEDRVMSVKTTETLQFLAENYEEEIGRWIRDMKED